MGNNVCPILKKMYAVTTIGLTSQDNYTVNIAKDIPHERELLDNTYFQLENAKQESQKEFPKEQELQEKQKRLDELNIKLNLNEKDKEILGNEIDDEKSQDSKNDRER